MIEKEKDIISEFQAVEELLSGHSIDCVVIGFEEGVLKVLVLKWREIGKWALPGGFIKKGENMDNAAVRILQDRTGIKLPFLDQFYTFGNVNRINTSAYTSEITKLIGKNNDFMKWINQRFISTGYFSLVDIDKCNIKPDVLSESCEWKLISELPNLIYDHNIMVDKALDKVRMKLNYLPIGITLLGKKFTMKELQKLYEAILKKKLDRGNFQKKMLKLNILIRLEKEKVSSIHKSAYLYRFDKTKYKKLINSGFGYIS